MAPIGANPGIVSSVLILEPVACLGVLAATFAVVLALALALLEDVGILNGRVQST